jgi:ABC-type lipoprotein export system ATPase subunit
MVNAAIDLVRLTDRASHRPYELSGGEQQRIAIARAVVHRPLLLIADEPTGELDSVNAKGIFSLLKDVCQNEGLTVVVATHDPAVVNFADPIYNMTDGSITQS